MTTFLPCSNFFKNKRVWVTGASSGIGEALAVAFAERGAQLVLSARNEVEINRVAARCTKSGATSVLVQPLDLERHESIPGIVESVLKKAGKVDILVNNGGISQRSLAKETSLDVDKKLMAVNFFGTVALTKALLPNMLMHQLGHIVTITSLTGKFGSPYRSSYAASKHALHGFFDSLRAELSDMHIKVTLICPGFVHTNVSKNALTGDGAKLGTMDEATEKGMEPERLAHKILQAIADGKEEAYFGGKRSVGRISEAFLSALFRQYDPQSQSAVGPL